MRKVVLVLLGVVAFWVGVNLVAWGVLGSWVRNIGNTASMEEMGMGVERLGRWYRWYPVVSMGGYKLPYVSEVYGLVGSGVDLAEEGLEVGGQVNGLVGVGLGGEEADKDEWYRVWGRMPGLVARLEALKIQLRHERVARLARLVGRGDEYEEGVDKVNEGLELLRSLEGMGEGFIRLMGYEGRQHYVVLLQNNMELWPTGGYMGSYAEFWMEEGALKDLHVEAIGVPNGQVKGYVEAPEPIATYTHGGGTPGWRLRESNWDPDFPEAMGVIEWFFVEGKVEPVEGMVAVNLIPVLDVLKVTGQLDLPDYNLSLTEENFYKETQKRTSYGFFDGSTQKRDYLGYAARHLLMEIMGDPEKYAVGLARVLYENLNNKQVLVAVKDEEMSEWFKERGWDGGLMEVKCKEGDGDCLADYIHVNEANLGVNKTNCCIDRRFEDEIEITPEGSVKHKLRLEYVNNNPGTPDPPNEWGGGYLAYVRVYVPEGVKLRSITGDGVVLVDEVIDVEVVKDKTVIGFPVRVQGGKEGSYEVAYEVGVGIEDAESYELIVQKQPGVEMIPWRVKVGGGEVELEVDRDVRLVYGL